MNPGVDIVRQRLLVLILGDVALLQHMIQHIPSPGGIFFRIGDGIIGGGILGDSRDHRTFGQGQFRHVFSEIAVGGSLYPVTAGSQIDGIQIILQDLFLGHGFFQLQGQVLLLDFPDKAFLKGSFAGPACKHRIFQKLLGDGAGSFRKIAAGTDSDPGRPQDALGINAVVGIEPLVLNGHYRMLQIDGNTVQGHQVPVGFREGELLHPLALLVIDIGSRLCRRERHIGNIRRVRDNLPQHGEADNGAHCQQYQNGKKKNAQDGKACFPFYSFTPGGFHFF